MLIRGVNAHPLCFDSIEGFKKKKKVRERERDHDYTGTFLCELLVQLRILSEWT